MNTLTKYVLIVTAMSVAALSFSVSAAQEADASVAAKKPAQEVSCKQEAKNKGIKDKAEKQTYIKQCEEKRKAAHSK